MNQYVVDSQDDTSGFEAPYSLTYLGADLDGLRRAIEAYPCCVLGPDGTAQIAGHQPLDVIHIL